MSPIDDNASSVTGVLMPTRAGYDQWASIYDVDGNPILALEEPLVESLLGDIRGLSVLDAGCGKRQRLRQVVERNLGGSRFLARPSQHTGRKIHRVNKRAGASRAK